ncbi:hypothetical protein Vqi01_09220 [Micromonospora qiuiae]|uniref:Uncharacterized protein n=1 Tax=Micromonospora qiuiae TaxID=502268 RepID=A0ABQ4J701_9ACTN|nr:hypothetical protein [Micromonospora qiuiae]GIJ25760.1 hypothetical protein Vqi01_09220 [Micromonospora qiuiae]
MPEPQPGADRPVDGNLPDPHRDGEPAVTEGQQPTPVPATEPPTVVPAAEPPSPVPTAEPPTVLAATDPPSTGPDGTRVLPDAAADESPAPRWSGSAPVPPATPRRRTWGESAEPTPPPPASPHEPEHQTPVDPWAGVDTSGWEVPSADFPALPPTLSYPNPPPTRPYSGPPAPTPPAAPAYPPPPAPTPPAAPAYPPPAAPMLPAAPAYPPAAPAHSAPAAQPPVHHAPPPPAPPVSPAGRLPVPAGPPPSPPSRSGWRGAKKAAPVAPPPGWQAPPGYVPVAVRKRRRWPWLLLLALACCCGCPAYYGMPMASQYPATASLPQQVADLRLREDPRNAQAARQLETQMRAAHWLADDTFAGVYTTSAGKRVTIFGSTGFRFAPSSEADAEIERLTEPYALGEVQAMESDVRGRHVRCAVGRFDGDGVVVCTSVDHGSIVTAAFTNLSVDDSARLLGTLREQIVTTDG